MEFILQPLNLLTFFPLVGVILLLLTKKEWEMAARWISRVTSLATFGIALWVLSMFDAGDTNLQLLIDHKWIEVASWTIRYAMGLDGLSILLVLLTALLTPISILSTWTAIEERVRDFHLFFLLLEVGMMGVFLAQDLFLFYVFWEFTLVPMYFLIGIWGGAQRMYAAIKFFLYTMAGSLPMLLAILWLGINQGSFYLPELVAMGGIPANIQTWLFFAFAIAFAIKVPMWPLHSWLPDAHVQAPTAGSVILAGVLLKMGTYGFVRFNLPLFPQAAIQLAPVFGGLAVVGILYGAAVSYPQSDVKKLVAYSSVNHMGFVLLGIAAAAKAVGTPDATIALNGAVLQMFNHGLSAAGMFFLVGVVYDRIHTRNLDEMGGYFPLVPVYGGILIFTSMASLGLPGLNGFVSEFLVVRGAWPIFTLWTALSMIGLLFTGAYILKGIGKTLHGPVNETHTAHLSEINRRELAVIAPLMVLMLWLGVWPGWLLGVINQAMMSIFG